MPCSDCGLSFICAGGRSPSDISNAAETRCDKGELSKVGIDIELTPALIFLSYLSRTLSLLGDFIRNLLLFYELKDSQSITETKMSYTCQNRKCRSIFAWIQILESYFTFG